METLRNEQFLRLLTTYPRGERTFVVAAGVEDEVESEWLIKAGIGQEYKPDDYLRLFEIFIEEHSEEIRAVSILLSKPSDWGVGPLRELREALLQAPEHFTESNLQKAFNATHHKALVDIISMVKRAADDETPLMTAEERAQAAPAQGAPAVRSRRGRAHGLGRRQERQWIGLFGEGDLIDLAELLGTEREETQAIEIHRGQFAQPVRAA